MKTDIEHVEEMSIEWLIVNGWTVQSNLVFRRCLEYLTAHKVPPPAEYIERLLLQYGINENMTQVAKIKEGLQEIIDIRNILNSLGN